MSPSGRYDPEQQAFVDYESDERCCRCDARPAPYIVQKMKFCKSCHGKLKEAGLAK